jgi:DNA modification methylase
MPRKATRRHSVRISDGLWDRLEALHHSNPAHCDSPSSFVVRAAQARLLEILQIENGAAEPERQNRQELLSTGATVNPSSAVSQDFSALLDAIGNAGSTGITAKQLATVTGFPQELVAQRLGSLSKDRNISKFGRGLWVLPEHADPRSLGSDEHEAQWYTSRFESEFALKVGRYSGDIQFGPNERLPVHRWWPYVQGFSADFVRLVCEKYGVQDGWTVLDPFCGSGTVPVVARSLGAKAIGVDMMPIVAFVSESKCEWEADPAELEKLAQGVLGERSRTGLAPPFLRETVNQFQPEVLESLLTLKQSIQNVKDGPAQKLLRLAFSSILVDASNLKRAPCLGYAKKTSRDRETPFRLFAQSVARIVEDLRKLDESRSTWGPPAEIIAGSSGVVRFEPGSVDLAITSPPYVNGMDYPTNYKIELAWMDFIDSYEHLAALRAEMVACDNIPRQKALEHFPLPLVRDDAWITSVTGSIDRNIRTKGAYRRTDMPFIVRKYFDDLVPVIKNVYMALKPGGRFVVVNGDSLIAGTYVPGDMIFARLAAGLGFRVEGFDIARIRRSGQRRTYELRETVLTLKKPGNGGRASTEMISYPVAGPAP